MTLDELCGNFMNISRKFKFRVWDKTNKRFLHTDCGLIFNMAGDLMGCMPVSTLMRNTYGYIVQQYTGLEDVNGISIYEGDIISCDIVGSDPMEVIFKDGKFTCDHLTVGCNDLFDEINQNAGHMVTGNIFTGNIS